MSEAERELRAMGAPDHVLEGLRAERGDGEFEVYPENWDTVVAFQAISTQWRAPVFGPDGKAYFQGLDYAGVEAGLRLAGIAPSAELFAGLRVMEAAARNQLNGIREDAA